MDSDTIATRGNHQPVWNYVTAGEPRDETRAGTTGIYTNPFGDLITGASKLGAVPEFSFFEVPEFPGTRFEVFPGAPSVTGWQTPSCSRVTTRRETVRQDRGVLP